jgi:hypothetical protein
MSSEGSPDGLQQCHSMVVPCLSHQLSKACFERQCQSFVTHHSRQRKGVQHSPPRGSLSWILDKLTMPQSGCLLRGTLWTGCCIEQGVRIQRRGSLRAPQLERAQHSGWGWGRRWWEWGWAQGRRWGSGRQGRRQGLGQCRIDTAHQRWQAEETARDWDGVWP